MKAHEACIGWDDLETKLSALEIALNVNDVSVIRIIMEQLVSDYTPSGEIVDRVYMEQEAEAQTLGLGN